MIYLLNNLLELTGVTICIYMYIALPSKNIQVASNSIIIWSSQLHASIWCVWHIIPPNYWRGFSWEASFILVEVWHCLVLHIWPWRITLQGYDRDTKPIKPDRRNTWDWRKISSTDLNVILLQFKPSQYTSGFFCC